MGSEEEENETDARCERCALPTSDENRPDPAFEFNCDGDRVTVDGSCSTATVSFCCSSRRRAFALHKEQPSRSNGYTTQCYCRVSEDESRTDALCARCALPKGHEDRPDPAFEFDCDSSGEDSNGALTCRRYALKVILAACIAAVAAWA